MWQPNRPVIGRVGGVVRPSILRICPAPRQYNIVGRRGSIRVKKHRPDRPFPARRTTIAFGLFFWRACPRTADGAGHRGIIKRQYAVGAIDRDYVQSWWPVRSRLVSRYNSLCGLAAILTGKRSSIVMPHALNPSTFSGLLVSSFI